MNQPLQEEIEKLADKFHDVYQKEIRRQGRLSKHNDKYIDLPEHIKNLDRVLAKYVLTIITKIRLEDFEKMREELGKDRILAKTQIKHYMDTGYNTAKYELRAYLDSKIKELEGVKSGSDK